MPSPVKIAIFISHPIQHFCPQFAGFSKLPWCSIKVFFASALGLKSYVDPSFGKEISWGNLGLDEFDHVFLNGDQVLRSTTSIDAVTVSSELDLYQPDVIITYGYFHKFCIRARNWAAAKNIPVALISDSENRRSRSLVKKLGKKVVLSSKFKKIQYFLSVGDANEEYYAGYGVDLNKIIRQPFPIDIVNYEKAFQNKELLARQKRKELGISEEAVVCSVVGKIKSFKRQQDIVRALQLLQAKTQVVLLVVGTGPDEEVVRNLSASLKNHQVIFTGFVYPEQLPEYYAVTDVYIHPSEMDAHSLAISEAVYMGCPVLLSDKCGSYGPTDDVQPGANGFVFPVGNTAALANLLSVLIQHPELRNEFSAKSRNIGVENQKLAHGGALRMLVNRVLFQKEMNR
jgi:glycosyltransferase involved in cell wall biosynthesis